MTFTFLHTADWQIGKPFANFPPELAGELAAARFAAIGRIAALARARGARHVLVAGDVFDGEDLPKLVLRRALERMAEQAGVTFVLLPGNHDPHRRGGVWDRVQKIGVPENVALALNEGVTMLTPSVALLAAPLTSKSPGRDPTAWMDQAVTAPGVLRIGLAHGSVQGFGSLGESAVPVARNRADTAGLAYLALGDWHGVMRVAANTWYSGTPEPDQFPNNEPGYILAVSLGGTSALDVEKIPSHCFSWARMAASVQSIADVTALERQMAEVASEPGRVLLRLTLAGSLSLSEHAALVDWQERWSARLRHLELDASAMAVRPTDNDIAALGSTGPLVEAALSLAATAADAADPDQAIAALALQRLFGFAAQAAHERGHETVREAAP